MQTSELPRSNNTQLIKPTKDSVLGATCTKATLLSTLEAPGTIRWKFVDTNWRAASGPSEVRGKEQHWDAKDVLKVWLSWRGYLTSRGITGGWDIKTCNKCNEVDRSCRNKTILSLSFVTVRPQKVTSGKVGGAGFTSYLMPPRCPRLYLKVSIVL